MPMAIKESVKNGSAKTTFGSVEQFLSETTLETEGMVAQYRKSAFQRFPLIFGLLVIVGSAATVFGIEHLLEATPLFRENPLVVLFLGLILLGFTGKLYKRLS